MSNFLEGLFRIGLQAERVPGTVLTKVLPKFRDAYPNVTIQCRFLGRVELESELISDQLDFAITSGVEQNDFIHSFACGEVEFVAAASPTILGKAVGSFDQMENVLTGLLIDVGPTMPLFHHWIEGSATGMADILAGNRSRVIVPNFHAAADLAASGGGVAVLPRSLIEGRLNAGDLVASKARIGKKEPLSFAYRKKASRGLLESVFIEHVMEHQPLV